MRMLAAAVVLVALLLMIPGRAKAQDAGTQPQVFHREAGQFGIGAGAFLGFGAGVELMADYNLTSQWQFHFAAQSEERDETNFFSPSNTNIFLDTYTIKNNRETLLASARYFPSADGGWYLGGGFGHSQVTQQYQDTVVGTVNSSADFYPVFFDGGWESHNRWFLTIHVFLGGPTGLTTKDNTSAITGNAEGKSHAQSDLSAAETFASLGVSAGYFF